MTEGMSVTLQCLDCYYYHHDYEMTSYDASCVHENGAAVWNQTLYACVPLECHINWDPETVEETTEEETVTCHSTRTFSCLNEKEFFSFQFGLSEISHHCTPRGWNISSVEACEGDVIENTTICSNTKFLQCDFKVLSFL